MIFIDPKNPTPYFFDKKQLKKYCKIISIKEKHLKNIILDSNIFNSGTVIFKNYKLISNEEFIDYVISVRASYEYN